MAKIDGQSFTIVQIEDSNYTQGDEVTKGVKLTMKESFSIDGNQMSKFHTTRVAIVKNFPIKNSERISIQVKKHLM